MAPQSLLAALELCANNLLIAMVGAGGKTSLMFGLASELRQQGRSVLVTTTTHIGSPENSRHFYDDLFIGPLDVLPRPSFKNGQIVIAARAYSDSGCQKLKGFSPSQIDWLRQTKRFDTILVEADGSRGRPLKAPADHEPQLPKKVQAVMGVMGLQSLGNPIREPHVHRPERILKISPSSATVTEGTLADIILSPQGLFKSTPSGIPKIVVLNQADTAEKRVQAASIAATCLKAKNPPCRVMICRLNQSQPVLDVLSFS